MATRAQVLELLEQGYDYETAARELQLPPGQVYMIATGLPADSSEAPPPDELAAKPVLPGSSQHLVNSATFNPTHKAHVVEWVKRRAERELKAG